MLQLVKKLILKKVIDSLKSRGYFVGRPHFYNPIPDKDYIKGQGYWQQAYPCHGIEFNDATQLSLLEKISSFANEIDELPEDVLNPQKNQSFLDMDLEFLYGMIRLVKPKNFIEIGAGWSTLISLSAIQKDKIEGYGCSHTIIEPYPNNSLLTFFNKADCYIQRQVQEIFPDFFNGLGQNDILFIDTSHVAKYGSDVNYLYFHILPMVGSGCYVHIHDIFLPSDYHYNWVFKNDIFWTEQYVVTAFLMYNKEFEIRIAAQYLSQKYRGRLNSLFPRFKPYFSPGSLWIQRKCNSEVCHIITA